MILHWIIADAVVLLAFLIQLAFPIDPEIGGHNIIFSNKIYYLNVPLYVVGWVILLAGYYIVWKLWLSDDWKRFKGCRIGWYIGGIVVELIHMFLYFVLFYLITYLRIPQGYYGGPYRWVGKSTLIVLPVLILLPLVFFIKIPKKS